MLFPMLQDFPHKPKLGHHALAQLSDSEGIPILPVTTLRNCPLSGWELWL